MMIIDGKKEAEILRQEIKKEIESLKSKDNKVPGLTVILIGDLRQARFNVKNKEKRRQRGRNKFKCCQITQKKLKKKKF